ncbi:NnrU family protein [Pseudooceanicola atlanticus]|uniref:NnrU family protein n=1 Tax=Pseudooceanicola atlanticus TaxID=1461694 RepID=A0A0A0EF46_9RHOB|nr:NnrU family protein [Pseudooceanicola atlanticus]KGM48905.1 NnrU family protein [Pseudooceanicola atlanticus]
MTGWTEYTLALAIFVASHFLPRIGGLRDGLIGAVGRRVYFSAYGLLSLALLVWVIVAAGRAPYVELWPQAAWTRWVPNIAMPIATVLVACGFGLRNPYTLGGKRTAIVDPDHPGFATVSRHPLFLALALWAGAHLVPNGDLAHVILFGSFTLMALAAIPAFDAKARRSLGPEATAFFTTTATFSLRPLIDRAWLRDNACPLTIRTIIGLVIWVVALHLHSPLIGASPFPF